MSKTRRFDNGLNRGRDDKPMGAKCMSSSAHPKGYDNREDDHGHYGAGGSRSMKKMASAARRVYHDRELLKIMKSED